MSKPSYYELRARAYRDINEKFYKDIETNQPIDPKLYIHRISLQYGLSKKFVNESLNVLIEMNGLKEENGLFVRGA